jgi:hypothetical protein
MHGMTSPPRVANLNLACPLCNKPINLERDRYADENGKIMHENCYVQRLVSSRNDPPDPNHAE